MTVTTGFNQFKNKCSHFILKAVFVFFFSSVFIHQEVTYLEWNKSYWMNDVWKDSKCFEWLTYQRNHDGCSYLKANAHLV